MQTENNHSESLATRVLQGPILAWLLFAPLFIWNYWPTWKWMIYRWEEHESYSSHGWLIPFVSAFLVWSSRQELAKIALKPNKKGLWLLVPAIFIHLIAGLADTSSISGFTILLMLPGFVLLTLGTQWLKILLFPILFLFFMIPLPDFIISGLNFRLKLLTADVAAQLLSITGLPAIREGSFMFFSEEKLAVGDVCSGLRSLLSLVALGVLYAWLQRSKGWIYIAVLSLAIAPAAIVGNGLRIFLVSYLVEWFGNGFVFTKIWGDTDVHLLSGFVIFAGALGFLWAVTTLLEIFHPHQPNAEQNSGSK